MYFTMSLAEQAHMVLSCEIGFKGVSMGSYHWGVNHHVSVDFIISQVSENPHYVTITESTAHERLRSHQFAVVVEIQLVALCTELESAVLQPCLPGGKAEASKTVSNCDINFSLCQKDSPYLCEVAVVEYDNWCQVPSLCVGYDTNTPWLGQAVVQSIKGNVDARSVARVKTVRLISRSGLTGSLVYCQKCMLAFWLEIVPMKIYYTESISQRQIL